MTPPDPDARNPEDVRQMFARTSKTYDAANRAMCMGLDVIWRRRLVRALLDGAQSGGSPAFLDAACGSGDVALEILKAHPGARVTGADFCAPMLEKARKKIEGADAKYPGKSLLGRAEFVEADCEHLPFADGAFSGATAAFGFRNFENREACLKEIRRVLKGGAMFHCLEVARTKKILSPAQYAFMKWIVPAIGAAAGGRREDYLYLGESTLRYPTQPEVEQIFRNAGFERVQTRPMMFGFVAITSARAPAP